MAIVYNNTCTAHRIGLVPSMCHWMLTSDHLFSIDLYLSMACYYGLVPVIAYISANKQVFVLSLCLIASICLSTSSHYINIPEIQLT